MLDIEEFQIRGLTGSVCKVQFGNRTVDFWAPRNPGGTLTKSGADEFKRIKGEVRLLEYLKQLDSKGK